jgi:thiol-disulfide isomerase/thioredoxin
MFKYYDTSAEKVDELNKYIEDGKDAFVFVYKEGCPPCMATKPEWKKIESVLKKDRMDNVIVAQVNQEFLPSMKYVGDIDGFPTMKYISKKGEIVEPYEESSIPVKDRSADSFVKWITSKSGSKKMGGSPGGLLKRLTMKRKQKKSMRRNTMRGKRKTMKGGKWSLKYKRSINCKRPKGFSQRQHCKSTFGKGGAK